MSDRLEITREEAERLLCAIEWTEGEGQQAFTPAEDAAWDSWAPERRATANAAHAALRDKLRAFVERTSPADSRPTQANLTGGEA